MTTGAIKFMCFLFLIFNAPISFGQYYYYNNKYYDNDLVFELGGVVGGMNCVTDIGGQDGNKKRYFNEINWKNTHLSGGIFFGFLYQQIVGARLEAVWGQVSAIDSLLKPSPSRYRRKLSFKSDIREISLVIEFHPIMLTYSSDEPPRISPYIMAGVGWFSFNPTANLDGNWINLQPLRTEGQGFKEFPDRTPYKLSQLNICGGLGVKYELSQLLNLRIEWMHRYLFTDYLDDASTTYIDPNLFSNYLSPRYAQQAKLLFNRSGRVLSKTAKRGDPKNTDAYLSINFKLGISLGRTAR